MTLYRGPGGTGSATSDADTTLYQDFLNQTIAARDAALQAEINAELAETNAETAETNAETAETNAETASTNAASSASAAASSASSASTSASNASTSASAASTAATNAASSASSASSSASSASTSASNAATSATNAANSASSASTSATNAANSASTATTQATNAASSATAAASSASSAATSATNAANSASAASTSATNAATSATSAAASATAAAASAASINPADLVHISGTETITGAKTFSQTITGSITGNAGTVTNGVYTTGDQTIAGTKTFSSNPILNAGTANGVAYLNGSKVLTTGSALTFDGTNLGIGGAASTKLHVQGTGTQEVRVTSSTSGDIRFGMDLFGVAYNWIDSLRSSVAMVFGVGNSEGMRLTSTGLGIGTSSPAAKLESVQATSGAGGWFMAGQFTAANYPMIRFAATSPNKYSSIGNNADGGLQFLVNGNSGAVGTTAVTIDPSGNLGLGVTPSAWQSGRAALQIGSGTSTSLYNTGNGSFLTNNMYVDTSGVFRYIGAGVAQRYALGSDGTHTWGIAASGSANAVTTLTQAMTLDASGNLALGLTSAQTRLHLDGSGDITLRINSSNNSAFRGVGLGATSADTAEYASFKLNANSGELRLFVGPSSYGGFQTFYTSGTERARIDSSGNLLVGTTSMGNTHAYFERSSVDRAILNLGTSSTLSSLTLANFRTPNGIIGSITVSSTSTAYNTSSDYRLKENIQPMTGALAKLAALKPCTYKWKADGSNGEGFIAHELAEVVPQCVTGDKDAVDAEGNPVYQGIDTSFLVATLTAAIQELKAEFDAYKATHP